VEHSRDHAHLMGQIAGIIAVISAVIEALPPTARKRLERHMHSQFESLLAAMQKAGASEAGTEFEGAKWVRDLYLQQIAATPGKSKSLKASLPADDTVDFQL
jgi:methionine salvage enolase-phosphatase E1